MGAFLISVAAAALVASGQSPKCGRGGCGGVPSMRPGAHTTRGAVALGHTPEFYSNPELAQMMLAGTQFVPGDLEVDTTPSAKLGKK